MLRTDLRVKDLDYPFLGKIVERLAQLFGLSRILQLHPTQDFRRKVGQSGKADCVLLAQRVTDTQSAVVGNPNNVTRFRRVGDFAILCEKKDRRMHSDGLAQSRGGQLHPTFERAGNLPHEGNTVTMVGVHIRLDLEDEAGDFIARWRNLLFSSRLRARGRRELRNRVDQLLDPKILQRRSEVDRG